MNSPPNSDKALDGLLARTLRTGAAADACPDVELLAAYYDRTLVANESARLETHFSTCIRCQDQLAALVRSEPVVAPRRSVWSVRWLVPVFSGAAALTIWIVMRPAAPLSTPSASVPQIAAQKSPAPFVADAITPKTDESLAKASNESSGKLAATDAVTSPPKPAKALDRDHLLAQLPPKPASGLETPSGENRTLTAAAPSAAPSVGGIAGRPEPSQSAQALSDEKKTQAGIPTETMKQAAPQQARIEEQQKPADELRFRDQAQGSGGKRQEKDSNLAQGGEAAALNQARRATANAALQLGRADSAAANQNATIDTESAKNERAKSAEVSKDKSAVSEFGVSAGLSKREKVGAMNSVVVVEAPGIITSPVVSIRWKISLAGGIQYSGDAGKTWHAQKSGTEQDLLAGSAPSSNICWIVGRAGTILLTTDGRSWQSLKSPTTEDVTAIAASDAQSATITSASGKRFSTSDAGRTWKLL